MTLLAETAEEKIRLLSIYTEYADRIRDGTKTFELRGYDPKIMPNDWTLIYEPKPTMVIKTVFKAEFYLCMTAEQAWSQFNHCFGISFEDYSAYFKEKPFAYAVKIAKVKTFDPISYADLVEDVGFTAPQGARYWNYKYIYPRILDAIYND